MKLILAIVVLSSTCYTQNWSGVLAASRGASEWANAGVIGGIPSGSWTRSGSLIAAGTSAATIQAALNACGTNHYVELGTGTFNLSSGLSVLTNCELRGQGANSTFLVFSGTFNCHGFTAAISMCSTDSTYTGSATTLGNWTANYSQGTTAVTLSSTTGIVLNQTLIVLDQCDDGYTGSSCTGTPADTGNLYQCNEQYTAPGSGCASEGGSNIYRTNRGMAQIVTASNIVGSTVTISPSIIPVNFRTGQSPQAWIITPIANAGVKNLSIQPMSADDGVLGFSTVNCWVDGIKVSNMGKSAVRYFQSLHSQVTNSYFVLSTDSDPYGVRMELSTNNLVSNNIIQQIRSGIVFTGPSIGDVISYNYQIASSLENGVQDTRMWAFLWFHSFSTHELIEGNIANEFEDDNIHSSHAMTTSFRNYFTGYEAHLTTPADADTIAHFGGWARYQNAIGNVLGRSAYHTGYQTTDTFAGGNIFAVGAGNSGSALPADPISLSTMMRWGNWDAVTNAVRYCTAVSTPIAACTVDEKGDGATTYPALTNPASTFAASFYLSSKPLWWGSLPWPSIGPDVNSATVYGSNGTASWVAQSVGGHVASIPALECFKNVMGGPADGGGSLLTFTPSTCYPNGSPSSGGSSISGPRGIGGPVVKH